MVTWVGLILLYLMDQDVGPGRTLAFPPISEKNMTVPHLATEGTVPEK